MLCKGRGFCGAMGNDASRVTVVDVCRGSLVRARVWARGRSKVILLHGDAAWSWCGGIFCHDRRNNIRNKAQRVMGYTSFYT